MIAIIDYNAGNLFSVDNALKFLNIDFFVAKKPQDLQKASGIILPGVGAFPWAVSELKKSGFFDELKKSKKPLLGICLGMQLLFDSSEEIEHTQGLGLIAGSVQKIEGDYIIPHMGWNKLQHNFECPLLKGIEQDTSVYFVHSFKAVCDKKYIASFVEYGQQIVAVVQKDNIFGCQFHPEKSSKRGLQILQNFQKIVEESQLNTGANL